MDRSTLALWISIVHLISNTVNDEPQDVASSSHLSTGSSRSVPPLFPRRLWQPDIARTFIELSITEIFLANHDVTLKLVETFDCTVSMLSFIGDMWMEKCITTLIFDENVPEFSGNVTMIHRFEQKQSLKIAFYAVNTPSPDDYPVFAYFSLGELVRVGKMRIPLKKNISEVQESDMHGYIVLDIAKLINEHVTLRLSMNHPSDYQFADAPDKIVIEICTYDEVTEEYDQVYETEEGVISPADRKVLWKELVIHTEQLCNGEYDQILKFTCWDLTQTRKRQIGQFETTLDEIANRGRTEFDLINEVQKVLHSDYTNSGQVHIDYFNVTKIHSLTTFIRRGLKIHSAMAIDFANGDPQNTASFHYHDINGAPSRYENVITHFARIIEDYSETIAVKGFGAQLNDVNNNHDFNVVLTSSLNCVGAYGVLQAYRECSENVVKSTTPAYIAPVIQEIIQSMEPYRYSVDNYVILLILVDRNIEDIEQTVKVMSEAHRLPISIAIIGSGNDHSQVIRRLNTEYKSSRIFWQYVPFNKSNPLAAPNFLSKEVLATVEKQVISYMQLHASDSDSEVIEVPR